MASIRHRYFFAIEMPPGTQGALRGLCRGLPQTRWVAEGSFHLTLAFLGELDRDRLEGLKACLYESPPVWPGFALRIGGVSCFRAANKKSVLWAGVEESPHLMDLQAALAAHLRQCRFRVESRKFRPHITLGRTAAYLSEERLHEWLFLYEHFFGGEIFVKDFCLYESSLYPEGARYCILERYLCATSSF